MNETLKPSITPWYKQFWPWFLIALPGSVVIASIITIIIASRSPHTVVVDDYYKEGLAINRDLGRQQLAEQLDVKATLQLGDGVLRLRLGTEDNNVAEQLLLRITHPTLSDRDQQLTPVMIAPGIYQAQYKPLSPGLWNIRLLSTSSNWEIQNRIKVESSRSSYTIR